METRRRLFYLTLMLSLYTMVFISSSFAETISGTVYGNNWKTPVPGIEIYVYNIWDKVDILESGTTDENGNYTISIDDVSSSEIILKAYAGHVTENYISTYYMAAGGYTNDWNEADSIVITEGQDITGIDFTLTLGGSISGTAYRSDGMAPLSDVFIEVWDAEHRYQFGYEITDTRGYTDSNGEYTIDHIPVGEVVVYANASLDLPELPFFGNNVFGNYVSSYYMESGGYAANWSEADLVTVTEGQETTGIDFSLGLGGWISGTVYESNGTTPAAGVDVSLYMADCGDFLAGGSTDENGKYVIGHLPGDRVAVYVDTYHLSENYFSGYCMASGYSDDCSGAIPVSVTVGEYTDKINFTLKEGEIVTLSEALDADSLDWSSGGNGDWFGQTSKSNDGEDAVQNEDIGDGEECYFETTVSGPGTVSFYWRVSSEPKYDCLGFFIDDEKSAAICGMTEWESLSFDVGSGAHTLKWAYSKDEYASFGADSAWVDRVTWTMDLPDDNVAVTDDDSIDTENSSRDDGYGSGGCFIGTSLESGLSVGFGWGLFGISL